MKFDYNAVLEAEIDDDDVIEAVVKNYTPEEVFPKAELEEWAEANGYVKEKEENDDA